MKFENIYIDIDDDVSAVVERILDAKGQNLVLSVPEHSKISESILNLRLLYREAKASQKNLFISTDVEEITAMAEEVGIPVLDREVKQPVPQPKRRASSYIRDIAPPQRQKASGKRIGSRVDGLELSDDSLINVVLKKKNVTDDSAKEKIVESSMIEEEITESDLNRQGPALKNRRFSKKAMGIGFIVFFVAILFFGFLYLFSQAQINLTTQKTEWQGQDAILASKSIDAIDANAFKVPAEYLKFSRQVSEIFPATGQKDVKEFSQGKVKIFNSYSSTPQILVANTRFMSSDGKLFRLASNLQVPGAQVQDGKIIPSSVDAKLIADQVGADYNISPSHFNIPGFQGTPKYSKFYAESSEAMTGGFVGVAKIITKSDLDDARSKLNDVAKISLDQEFQVKFPTGFKLLNEAKTFNVDKIVFSNKEGDRADNFRGDLSLSLKALVFKEDDIQQIFVANAIKDNSTLVEKELVSADFSYGSPRLDFDKGLLSFPVSGHLVFRNKIDSDNLKSQIAGMSAENLNRFFSGISGLEKVEVIIKPHLFDFMPLNSRNLKITIN